MRRGILILNAQSPMLISQILILIIFKLNDLSIKNTLCTMPYALCIFTHSLNNRRDTSRNPLQREEDLHIQGMPLLGRLERIPSEMLQPHP
jgi:hypothetical protein